MRIESLADHVELIETLGRWHWDEWGDSDPGGSLLGWTENLRRFTQRHRIPTLYVALEGDELLGSVSLNECDMDTRADLTPWLGGLLVKPEARGRGVATALVRHLEERAGGMGVRRLYLYTNSARGLYQKLGWQVMGLEPYEGKIVTLMSKEI